MEDTRVTFETAKLAKERGFDINGQDVFDLKNNNKIINFKDLAVQEFIKDVETGYRDKALNYLKENINITDDNSDEEYYLLAPTQSLLAKWLRERYNIHFEIKPIFDVKDNLKPYHISVIKNPSGKDFEYKIVGSLDTYEETLEIGLYQALLLL